jgi:tetratricopeptide (TPR) repeat protein
LARAAAKGNKRARKTAQPKRRVGQGGASTASIRRYHPEYETQLFFGKIRRRTKWVFAVLAVVFALSFAFLGVGSGGGALSDLWNGRFGNLFGGSSGPSISGLEKKIAKDPKNASLRLQLAQLTGSKGTPDQQIAAYDAYLKLRPKNSDGLTGLANAYGAKVQEIQGEIQSPPTPALSAAGNFQLASSSSKLGQGLASVSTPLLGVSLLQQGEVDQLNVQLGKEIQKHAGVYRRIWQLTPNDSGAFLAIAQVQESDGATVSALATYREFLKRFPNDALVPDVKKQITSLQKSIASSQSSTSTSAPTG